MSDEHAAEPDAADDESGDSLEPGGGPQRVVSEESVDDILASLDETKSGSTDTNDTAVTADDPDDTVTTTFDEDDVPTADESTDTSQPDTTAAPETETVPTGPAAESASATDTSDGDAPDAQPRPDATTDDTSTVDAAASSLPDDASLEELAARVEEGTVTGADVRAAEAGDGRDSTPEIDEVDLSLDDLETTETGVDDTGDAPGVPDDAGPLAGSVDRDGAPDESGESDDSDDSDDTPGLLGRVKNFFSG